MRTIHAPQQLTRVNDELFKDIRQSEPEEIWYKSFDGKNIDPPDPHDLLSAIRAFHPIRCRRRWRLPYLACGGSYEAVS